MSAAILVPVDCDISWAFYMVILALPSLVSGLIFSLFVGWQIVYTQGMLLPFDQNNPKIKAAVMAVTVSLVATALFVVYRAMVPRGG